MSAGADGPFRDAEAWLARQGVRRDPIRVPAPDGPPPSATEARRLAASPVPDPSTPVRGDQEPPAAGGADGRTGPGRQVDDEPAPELGDEVARAMGYVRRATAATPMSEGRLREKLAARDHPPVVVEHALRRARRERLVDDRAMARALLDERRAKGHAPARLRTDLRRRGFDDGLIDELLAPVEGEDQEAVAFDVAHRRADRYAALDAESAFRRLVGYLARRGFPEALARKVSREVVFAARRHREAAEH